MKRYKTILIDPPWAERGGGKSKRGADRHYPVLSRKKIYEAIMGSGVFLPDENSHLYLWSTNNYLEEGLTLIGELGFRFITVITWGKPSIGLGRYFRGQTEQLLFAVRGNGWSLREERLKVNAGRESSTLLLSPRVKGPDGRPIHSAKPRAAYQLIEASSPPPRLEMFARPGRKGWAAWGNEAAPRRRSSR